MNSLDHNSRFQEERWKKDQIEIIRNLHKGRFSSALELLSHYRNYKMSGWGETDNIFGEYFILIQTAYAHYGLHQHADAKSCLEKILSKHPLDGQANLFMAYLYLLEDNKPEAIHRYSVLLENPFYRSRVTKILERIRHSNSIIDLLGEKSIKFFYQHEFPDIFWEVWKIRGSSFLNFIKNILNKSSVLHRSGFLKLSWLKFWSKGKGSPARSRSFLSRKELWVVPLLIMVAGFYALYYREGEGFRLIDKIPFFSEKKNNPLFSESVFKNYSQEKVSEWTQLYRDMEEKINLRQFNAALKIYNTINRNENLPIEVKNKFYILSTFITVPRFEELNALTAFTDIPMEEIRNPIGLYYKFAFKVLQVSRGNRVSFLVDLLSPQSSTQNDTVDKGFSPRRAILLLQAEEKGNPEIWVGEAYEVVAQLQTQGKKYLIFTAVVVRAQVKSIHE